MSEKSVKSQRQHDVPPSDAYAAFMQTGWTPSDLKDLAPSPAVAWCANRRAKLSAAYPGVRLIIPAGNFKVRTNDSDYRFRPHSAFAYYTGVQGVEATADSILIMEPTQDGHEPILYIHPRSTRDTDAFYRDAKYGELWVGRRFTIDEAHQRWQMETRKVSALEELLCDKKETILLRGEDSSLDAKVEKSDREAQFVEYVSGWHPLRLVRNVKYEQ